MESVKDFRVHTENVTTLDHSFSLGFLSVKNFHIYECSMEMKFPKCRVNPNTLVKTLMYFTFENSFRKWVYNQTKRVKNPLMHPCYFNVKTNDFTHSNYRHILCANDLQKFHSNAISTIYVVDKLTMGSFIASKNNHVKLQKNHLNLQNKFNQMNKKIGYFEADESTKYYIKITDEMREKADVFRNRDGMFF